MEGEDDFVTSADHVSVRASLTRLALLPFSVDASSTQQEVWLAWGWLQAACIAWGRIQPQDSIPVLSSSETAFPGAAKLCKAEMWQH